MKDEVNTKNQVITSVTDAVSALVLSIFKPFAAESLDHDSALGRRKTGSYSLMLSNTKPLRRPRVWWCTRTLWSLCIILVWSVVMWEDWPCLTLIGTLGCGPAPSLFPIILGICIQRTNVWSRSLILWPETRWATVLVTIQMKWCESNAELQECDENLRKCTERKTKNSFIFIFFARSSFSQKRQSHWLVRMHLTDGVLMNN